MGKSSLPPKFSGSFCGMGFPHGWFNNDDTSARVDDLNRRATLRRAASNSKEDPATFAEKTTSKKRLVKRRVLVEDTTGKTRVVNIIHMDR